MQIGFVLFPHLTLLDLTGPLQVLSRLPGASSHSVAKSLDPVPSDCGLSMLPTTTFEACPQLDLIVVPGGAGVVDAIRDRETVEFLRTRAEGARYVTSVCTGAFLLGAAGLLRDRRATTHWAFHHLLPLVGAIPTSARSVTDGPICTGAGVTAGIDFALSLVAELAGPGVARTIQLEIEYDPKPPFDAGSPERAEAEQTKQIQSQCQAEIRALREAVASVRHASE